MKCLQILHTADTFVEINQRRQINQRLKALTLSAMADGCDKHNKCEAVTLQDLCIGE